MDNYISPVLIGEGSFSKVYQSVNKRNNKKCVLKVITLGEIDFKNILTEIHILTKNKTKYLVSSNDVFFDPTKNKIVIELQYFPDGDLADKIRSHADKKLYFPEDTVWKYFTQILYATKYLHDNGIIHRDIKTSNLLITKLGNLKLIDFNTCKTIGNNLKMSLKHTQIGTPYYMSPELINNSKYNYKVDIWSIGCVLYEIILLKQAFKCNHIGRLMINIRSGNFNPIKEDIVNKYSVELLRLINVILDTNENKRPSVYDLLQKIPKEYLDKNETIERENKTDINLLQDVYVPKSFEDFNKVIKKFYNGRDNKIDVSKYLLVKKCT